MWAICPIHLDVSVARIGDLWHGVALPGVVWFDLFSAPHHLGISRSLPAVVRLVLWNELEYGLAGIFRSLGSKLGCVAARTAAWILGLASWLGLVWSRRLPACSSAPAQFSSRNAKPAGYRHTSSRFERYLQAARKRPRHPGAFAAPSGETAEQSPGHAESEPWPCHEAGQKVSQ